MPHSNLGVPTALSADHPPSPFSTTTLAAFSLTQEQATTPKTRVQTGKMEYDGTLKDLCEELGIPWDPCDRQASKGVVEVLFNSDLTDSTVRHVFNLLQHIRWPAEVRAHTAIHSKAAPYTASNRGQDDGGDGHSTRDRVPRPLKYAGYLESLLNRRYVEGMSTRKRERWARDARKTGMREPSDGSLLLPTVAIHETLWNQGLTPADDLYNELFRCRFVRILMGSWDEHAPEEAITALRRRYLTPSAGGEEWWGAGNQLGGAGALVGPGTFEYIFTRKIRVGKPRVWVSGVG